jgi:LysM repeat protein
MPKQPKTTYLILLLIIIVALTGCQMPRDDSGDLSTTTPPTPTLASLGDNAQMSPEATPVPTIINVQPTATQGLTGEGQEADKASELSAPTSQAPEMAITPLANPAQVASPETFVPPANTGEQSIIVNAPSSDLADGGPVAVNPPAAQPSSFAVPATDNSAVVYGGSTYIVQYGDTLFSISMRYGVTVQDFMVANGLTSDFIYEGQSLTVPASGDASAYAVQPGYNQAPVDTGGYNSGSGYHVVAAGETLFSIAQWYGTSVEALAAANGLSYPYIIYEGQNLSVSGAAPGGYYNPQKEIQPYPADGYYQQQPVDNYYQQPQQPAYPPAEIAGTHTVAPGQTLFSIAQQYGTSAQAIAEANGLANPNQIYVGQVLYLP